MTWGDAVALVIVAGLPAALGFWIARWWFVLVVTGAWGAFAVGTTYATEPHEQGEFAIYFLISAVLIATLCAALGVGARRTARLVWARRGRQAVR